MNPGHPDRLKLLDHRIGTLLKLKKLDEALKDAKTVIREARSDGRGYLRCGQLESLQANNKAALKWYEHGVKNVSPSDRLHAPLQAKLTKTRDLVQKEHVQSNPRDPMATLPLEIVEMIIACLEFKTLVASTRVSRSWKDILCSLPPLTDTLDFSGASASVSYHQFRVALRRLKKYPRKAVLCSLREPASKLLPEHLERWFLKNCLEHLEVDDKRYSLELSSPFVPKLTTVVFSISAPIAPFQVFSILKQCTRLTYARFDNVSGRATDSGQFMQWSAGFDQPALKHLELRSLVQGRDSASYNIWASAFNPFRNLETLRCSGLSMIRDVKGDCDLSELPLKHLEISRSALYTLPKLPPTLSELNLLDSWVGDSDWGQMQMQLPQLEHLNLFGASSFGVFQELLFNVRMNGSLRTLHLDGNAWPGQLAGHHSGFLGCLDHYSVKNLRLRWQYLGDDDTDSFIRKVPNVETVRLENARITGVFIAALLRRPDNKLKYLCLQDCDNVSRDAIEFARSLGVTVEVKCTQSVQGGRRLVQAY